MPVIEIIKTENEFSKTIHSILLPPYATRQKYDSILLLAQELFTSLVKEINNSISDEELFKAINIGNYQNGNNIIIVKLWQNQEK